MPIQQINNLNVLKNKNITFENEPQNQIKPNSVEQKDEFVNKEHDKKEGLTKKQKIWIGVGGGASLITVAGLIIRGRLKQATKLAKEIVFKKAETIEEAIEFAKKNLKINKFNLDGDVELANWVNEGLVRLSNKHKGKVYMPSEVRNFTAEELAKYPEGKLPLASMNSNIKNFKMRPIMKINKSYFDQAGKNIEKNMESLGIKIGEKIDKNHTQVLFYHLPFFDFKKMSNIANLCIKHTEKTASKAETIATEYALGDFYRYYEMSQKDPMTIIKRLYSDKKSLELLQKHLPESKFMDIGKLEKLSVKDQSDYLWGTSSMLSKKISSKEMPSVDILNRKSSPFYVIFHEEGHLFHHKNNLVDYFFLDKVGTYKGKVPKEAQDFHDDKVKQAIASTVSSYAKASPLEFVAEVYAGLVNGHKFNDEVMNLYKFYKGYMLAA